MTFIAPDKGPALSARLALILIGLAWVLPFFSPNFREPISSFYGEATAVLLGLLALSCLLSPSLWTGLALPRSSMVFLGFAALILLHLLLGRYVYLQQDLLAILYLLWALALAMLAWRLREIFGQERVVTALSRFLLAGAVLSAAICLCQVWGIRSPLSPFMLPRIDGRILANTGQPNHLANYLSLGLASLTYLYAMRKLGLPLVLAAAALLLVAMELSGSRAIFLYLVALLALAGIFRLMSPSQATSRLLGFSAAAAAGMMVVAAVLPDLLPGATGAALETLQTRLRSEGLQSSVRMRQGYEAWLMFLDAPLFGIGYRQFAWQHFLLNAQMPPPRLFEAVHDHAHNLLLHTMAEFGLIGLAVLIAGFVVWILGVRRDRMSVHTWWLFALIAILGIHSMLEYPLWYAYFLGIAAIVIGISDPVMVRVGSRSGGRLVLVATLLLGWMAAANIYRDYRTLQSLHSIEPQKAGAEAGGGRNATAVLLDLQQHSLFSPYVELALSRLMVLDRAQIENKLVLNEAVMRFSPSADVVYRHAILLALDDRTEQAQAQWDLAEKNFSGDAAGVIQLMRVLPGKDAKGVSELIRHADQSGTGKKQ